MQQPQQPKQSRVEKFLDNNFQQAERHLNKLTGGIVGTLQQHQFNNNPNQAPPGGSYANTQWSTNSSGQQGVPILQQQQQQVPSHDPSLPYGGQNTYTSAYDSSSTHTGHAAAETTPPNWITGSDHAPPPIYSPSQINQPPAQQTGTLSLSSDELFAQRLQEEENAHAMRQTAAAPPQPFSNNQPYPAPTQQYSAAPPYNQTTTPIAHPQPQTQTAPIYIPQSQPVLTPSLPSTLHLTTLPSSGTPTFTLSPPHSPPLYTLTPSSKTLLISSNLSPRPRPNPIGTISPPSSLSGRQPLTIYSTPLSLTEDNKNLTSKRFLSTPLLGALVLKPNTSSMSGKVRGISVKRRGVGGEVVVADVSVNAHPYSRAKREATISLTGVGVVRGWEEMDELVVVCVAGLEAMALKKGSSAAGEGAGAAVDVISALAGV